MIIIGIIIVIVIIILGLIILEPEEENNNKKTTQKNVNYSEYYKKDYVMTPTELNFYRQLKNITDKLDLTIFPEVDLERIINVKGNNSASRNRIKSRSIDYTIVNNKNCKIICCIELDDYTHNRNSRKQRDEFINELFKSVGLELFRIKVGSYNFEDIEKNIRKLL